MHALLSRWIPSLERSRAVTFVYSGAQFGTVIGMPLSGVLCDHGFAGGWPSVFYVFGTVGRVWAFAWFMLCILRRIIYEYHWLNITTLRCQRHHVILLKRHQYHGLRLQPRYHSGLVLLHTLDIVVDTTHC